MNTGEEPSGTAPRVEAGLIESSPSVSSQLTERDRQFIAILLAEYTAMRNQVISRGASLIQVAAIGVASLAVISVQIQYNPFLAGGLFLFLLAIVGMLWRFIKRDIDREAGHVRYIESAINNLATGQSLLTWETFYGGAKVGYTTDFWAFLPLPIRAQIRKGPLLTWLGFAIIWIASSAIYLYGFLHLVGQAKQFLFANGALIATLGPPILVVVGWLICAWAIDLLGRHRHPKP